jgi:hypothetical protein
MLYSIGGSIVYVRSMEAFACGTAGTVNCRCCRLAGHPADMSILMERHYGRSQ